MTTTSTTNVVNSATQSLLTSLNAGSGVDTASLVQNLVQAQFAAKAAQLTAKTTTLTSQISGVSTVKSAISGFSTALQTLVKGGTLATQPASSDSKIVTATALPGAKLADLSTSIAVSQLAAAQLARTNSAVADRGATIGSGRLTLTFGTATYNAAGNRMTGFTAGSAAAVDIDVTDASLDGIAAAINAKRSGVTAAVVTDASGAAYLSLKGQTGAAQAFTLTSADSALQGLTVQPAGDPDTSATSITGAAQNARLSVDGIAVERASNTVSDLVAGVKLQLTGTSTTAATLTGARPGAALSQAVQDVVDTYNQVLATLNTQIDAKTGTLRADPAAQSLLRSLQGLTLKSLGDAASGPRTLAEIGVGTNRDGTLKLDSASLAKAMAANPDAVEAMFASTTTGLSKALSTIADAATSTVYGLGASETRYNAAKSDLATAQEKIAKDSETMTTRLTAQFAAMNARVNAYKSTQTFLENQVKAWNKSDS